MPFPHRLAAAGAALAACLAAFVVLLWDTQVTNGPAYAARAQRSIAQMETAPAARGRLLRGGGAREGRAGAGEPGVRCGWIGELSIPAAADLLFLKNGRMR